MLRTIAAAAALLVAGAAYSQTTTFSPASQQVQLLGPQLVAFAGSAGNFDSLVTGLTSGTPVTLTTLGADGVVQIVTFVPTAVLTPLDAARNLETARQNLIARGIATPSAQQLGVALVGGTLVTPTGRTALAGVLTGTALPTSLQVRTELATEALLLGSTPGVGLSGANLQALRNALATGSAVTLTSTTSAGTTQSTTFTPTTRRLNAFEANQLLQLAATLLAQQGIFNPTPEQVRAALLGGTLTSASGTSVPVQGVLQATSSTSSSPLVNTSNSSFTGTSDSSVGTSNTPNPASAGATQPTTGTEPARTPSREVAPVFRNQTNVRRGG